jgi:TATA-box binding protein (TBP) (component of TFIID and TFIIIB)
MVCMQTCMAPRQRYRQDQALEVQLEHYPCPAGFMHLQVPTDAFISSDKPIAAIQNIVSTVHLGVPIDLARLRDLPCCQSRPDKFSTVTMRIAPTVALVFAGGKIIITRSRTENEALLASHYYRLMICCVPHVVRFRQQRHWAQPIIQTYHQHVKHIFKPRHNIVAKGFLQMDGINLGQFNKTYQFHCQYTPRLFPGLILSVQNPKCKVTIFDTCMANIMGLKHEEHRHVVFDQVCEMVKHHRDPHLPKDMKQRLAHRLRRYDEAMSPDDDKVLKQFSRMFRDDGGAADVSVEDDENILFEGLFEDDDDDVAMMMPTEAKNHVDDYGLRHTPTTTTVNIGDVAPIENATYVMPDFQDLFSDDDSDSGDD